MYSICARRYVHFSMHVSISILYYTRICQYIYIGIYIYIYIVTSEGRYIYLCIYYSVYIEAYIPWFICGYVYVPVLVCNSQALLSEMSIFCCCLV